MPGFWILRKKMLAFFWLGNCFPEPMLLIQLLNTHSAQALCVHTHGFVCVCGFSTQKQVASPSENPRTHTQRTQNKHRLEGDFSLKFLPKMLGKWCAQLKCSLAAKLWPAKLRWSFFVSHQQFMCWVSAWVSLNQGHMCLQAISAWWWSSSSWSRAVCNLFHWWHAFQFKNVFCESNFKKSPSPGLPIYWELLLKELFWWGRFGRICHRQVVSQLDKTLLLRARDSTRCFSLCQNWLIASLHQMSFLLLESF